MIESALLLFLVIDPFGNLPFVLAVLSGTEKSHYRKTILRETLLALLVLVLFALVGEALLGYLSIERASLMVAGGVILFLISLKMIFQSAKDVFAGDYSHDSFLFPIAVPCLAGPSAALLLVLVTAFLIFLLGHRLSDWLGERGIRAVEKLMGLLLNLVAVNMMLIGVRDFLA